jgi:hypothetical protein
MLRRYDPNAQRQQRADRLVYDEVELRQVLGEALLSGTAATIRLGGNIILTSSIVLAGEYEVVIDGADRFGFVPAATVTMTEFFSVQSGVTVEGLTFQGVNFRAFPNLVIRCADSTCTLYRVNFRDCHLDFVHDLVLGDVSAPTWADSTVEGCTFLIERDGVLITPGLGQAVLARCTISRCNGVRTNGSVRAVSVDNAAGSDGNFFLGVTARSALGASDVYLATSNVEESVLGQPLVVGTYPASLSTVDFTTVQARNGGNRFTLQGSTTTSGAVSVTLAQFSPQPSRSYLVTSRIIGRRTNGADPGQTDIWFFVQGFKVSSAGVVTVGAVLGSSSSSLDDATWAAALDTSGGAIRVRAAGVAAQNISWTTITEVVEC